MFNSKSIIPALVAASAAALLLAQPAVAQTANKLKCKGCVKSKQIKNDGIKSKDIRDGSIQAEDLAPGAVSDTLADLNCSQDQIARFIDGAWQCVTGGATYVFLGSEAHDGAFGTEAWDGVCQAEAEDADLPPGDYRAFLSTSAFDAGDMLPPGPFYLPTGDIVALSKADLLDGLILTEIDTLASGDDGTVLVVWTGTRFDGTLAPLNCLDWSSNDSSDRGHIGSAIDENTWTTPSKNNDFFEGACNVDTAFTVYCFQVR